MTKGLEPMSEQSEHSFESYYANSNQGTHCGRCGQSREAAIHRTDLDDGPSNVSHCASCDQDYLPHAAVCGSAVPRSFEQQMADKLINCAQQHAALVAALRIAAPHVCGLLCPSTKRTGEEWTHVQDCKAITDALELAKAPRD